MKIVGYIQLAFLCALSVSAVCSQAAPDGSAVSNYEILVAYKEKTSAPGNVSGNVSKGNVSKDVVNAYSQRLAGKVLQKLSASRRHRSLLELQKNHKNEPVPVYRISVSARSLVEAVQGFRKDPEVLFAEPNYEVHINTTPNDPYYLSTESTESSVRDLWGVHAINTASIWDYSTGNGTVVAVIDTGLQIDHEDIAENVWVNPDEIADNGIDDDGNGYIDDVNGWSFVDSSADVTDLHGHGTHVAGTIAAVGNNGIGIIGVAPKTKILPLQGLDRNGTGNHAQLIEAIYYAVDMGVDIINLSWGGYQYSLAIRQAVDYARESGVVVIAAAGNDATNASYHYPSGYESVISVGAVTEDGVLAPFSNYGDDLDVVAPGEGILSLLADGSAFENGFEIIEEKYLAIDGTSMAAPHVSGLAALILAKNPEYTPDQVRNQIRNAARRIETGFWNTRYGYGFIDAERVFQDDRIDRINVKISTPAVHAGAQRHSYLKGILEVTGTASGDDFAGYAIQIVPLEDGRPQFPLVDIYRSNTPVVDDVLAQVDLEMFDDGEYLIRLAVESDSGQIFDSYRTFIKDRQLKEGWPQMTVAGRDTSMILKTVSGVEFADLDADGIKEVISAHDNLVYAWRANGSLVSGFPLEMAYPLSAGVTVVDLDNDNDLELVFPLEIKTVVQSGSKVLPVYAFHHDGTLVSGFPAAPLPLDDVEPGVKVTATTRFKIVAEDIDQDGYSELIFSCGAGNWNASYVYLFVLESNGEVVDGWPQKITDERPLPYRQVALIDSEGDGSKEIIVTTETIDVSVSPWEQETALKMYARNGELLRQASAKGLAFNEPRYQNLVADMNGDGREEIFSVLAINRVGSYTQATAYLFNSDLTTITGWPVQKPLTFPVSLIDINADELPEIVSGYESDSARITALNYYGREMAGFPVELDLESDSFYWDGNLFAAAQTDQFDSPVLIASGNNRLTGHFASYAQRLLAFSADGELLKGWPKRIEGAAGEIAVGDIDRDGLVDIAVQGINGAVYVWEEPANQSYHADSGIVEQNWQVSDEDSGTACIEYLTTLEEHVRAGRAVATTEMFWWTELERYYLAGSDELAGSDPQAELSVIEVSPDYFMTGSCLSESEMTVEAVPSYTATQNDAGSETVTNEESIRWNLSKLFSGSAGAEKLPTFYGNSSSAVSESTLSKIGHIEKVSDQDLERIK